MNIKITREYIENEIKADIELEGREIYNVDLSNLNLNYENLNNTKFIGVNLHKCNLDNADLNNALFINSDLSFATIRNANVKNTKFINCVMKGCDFSNSNLDETIFFGTTDQYLNMECDINLDTSLTNMTFKAAHLDSARFTNIRLDSSNFRETRLNNAEFTNCLLESVEFNNASLVGSTLTDCRVIECDFSQTKCAYAMFENIPGIRNNFAHANLNHTLFRNINMSDINFQFTTGVDTRFETVGIKDTNFEYSKLKNTIFKNTNLTGIKLGNKHFEQIYGKEDVSKTIDFSEFVNKSDTTEPAKTSKMNNPISPIKALEADIDKLMQNIIDDLRSISDNDDEALLRVYSKQIAKIKDIINRIKNDNKLPDDIKEATLDFIGDMAAVFEYRKIGFAAKSSIGLTLKNGYHEPCDCTDKIKPNNTFTDEFYGFYISPLTAEHMVKAYKNIHGTNRIEDWSVADIMINCLDITEVNFTTYTTMIIDFINNLERYEYDGFIIKATKNKPPIINKDKLIKACKTHYGLYLPDDFDYKNNIVLFRGRYKV